MDTSKDIHALQFFNLNWNKGLTLTKIMSIIYNKIKDIVFFSLSMLSHSCVVQLLIRG
jgi:hypothetical protein